MNESMEAASAEMGASAEASAPAAATEQSGSVAQQPRFPLWVYKVALVFATMIWGLSFVVMKSSLDSIPTNWLLGIRFVLCGLIMAGIFWKRMVASFNRDHLLHGFVIGLLLYIAYWFQTVGLTDTTPGKNAFLTAVYCVIVPFVWWVVARRRPTVANIVAAVMAIVGIGLVSLGPDAFSGGQLIRMGDAMTIVCAVFFALHIVYVAKVNPGRDIYVLTTYQFIFAGLLALVVGVLTEPVPTVSVMTPQLIMELAYLTLFSSLIALLIQNVALQYVPPAQASLFLCLESVFGVLFSVIFASESVTLRLAFGFVTIFLAVVVSESGTSIQEKLTRGKRKPHNQRSEK